MIRDEKENLLLISNASIYTLDSKSPKFEAMAVRGGKIWALGSSAELRNLNREGFKEVDLAGKTVLPGFIDTHCHAMAIGIVMKTFLGVQDVSSIEEMKERVRQRVKEVGKGEWIKGRGWCKGVFANHMPTRWDLDEVAPDNPVVLVDASGHISVINSKAISEAGITRDTQIDHGEIDKDRATGQLNGILRDTATYRLVWMKGPNPTEQEILEAARMICNLAAQKGITSLSSIMMMFPSKDAKKMGYSPLELKPYVTLRRRNELPIRIRLMIHAYQHWGDPNDHTFLDHLIGLGLQTGFGDDQIEIGGIKALQDGSIIANTGAMREPYDNDPSSSGILYYNQEQLNNLVLKSNENGFQIEVHAHGDLATDLTLNAYENALMKSSVKCSRNIITHVRVLHDEQIKRIKDLGVMINATPGVNGWLPTRYAVEAYNVGDKRAKLLSRIRTMLDNGIMVAAGSDCHACHPFGPLHFIFRAINRGNFSCEAPLTIDEAVRLWTINSAYVSFAEDKKGSLECGKLADFVVLSEDPFIVAKSKLDQIQVEKTYVGGEKVWDKMA